MSAPVSPAADPVVDDGRVHDSPFDPAFPVIRTGSAEFGALFRQVRDVRGG